MNLNKEEITKRASPKLRRSSTRSGNAASLKTYSKNGLTDLADQNL